MLLSICIPTFNRKEFLKSTLDNLVAQVSGLANPADVEIIVSDNASTDGTAEVLAGFSHPCLVKHRNAANIGVAPNLNLTLDMAKGRHCWLMGDDDQVRPGALQKIVKAVAAHPEAALFYINYRRINDTAPIIDLPRDLYFGTAEEYIDYGLSHFNINEWDPAKFTFYTSLIVSKEKWYSAPANDCLYVSHAYTIHSFLPGAPVYLFAEPLVIMNDVPHPGVAVHKHYLYPWLKIYWFMGVRYRRKAGFARVMVRACLANMKYRTVSFLRGLSGRRD